MKIKNTTEFQSSFPIPSENEHAEFMDKMRKRRIVINVEPLHKKLPCHQLPKDRFVTFQHDGRLVQISEHQLAMKGFYQK